MNRCKYAGPELCVWWGEPEEVYDFLQLYGEAGSVEGHMIHSMHYDTPRSVWKFCWSIIRVTDCDCQ